MDVDQLTRELQAETSRPVYLLTGSDTFLVEEALRALIEGLVPPDDRDLAVVRLYADETEVEVEQILDEARTMPFFGHRRLIVVRRVEAWHGLFSPPRKGTSPDEETGGEKAGEDGEDGSKLEARRQRLLDYLDHPNPTTHLIFIGHRVDGRLPVVRRLRADGAVVECKPYRPEAAIRWVRERARTLGCSLTREGAAFLVEHVGPDLQRLAREVEKLAEHGAEGTDVPREVLERVVAGYRERRIFELTDAIARQDVETALRRLETLLTIGEGEGKPLGPLQVLGSLASQVRRVWLVKESDEKGLPDRETYNEAFKTPVRELSAWHRERLTDLRRTAERFSEAGLARAFRRLLQADAELKGEGTNDRQTLETLVMDLCAGDGERDGP